MTGPRLCSVQGCNRKHHSRGYCPHHYYRAKTGNGDPLREPMIVNTAERLEDVQWMVETGECMSGAAERLGISRDALDVWLRRNDPGSLARLLAREPKDHNRVLDGVSVSELTGQRARRQRRRECAA